MAIQGIFQRGLTSVFRSYPGSPHQSFKSLDQTTRAIFSSRLKSSQQGVKEASCDCNITCDLKEMPREPYCAEERRKKLEFAREKLAFEKNKQLAKRLFVVAFSTLSLAACKILQQTPRN